MNYIYKFVIFTYLHILFYRNGRHKPIVMIEKSKVTEFDEKAIKVIFETQDSELMEMIKKCEVGSLQECCENTINNFSGDLEKICVNTKNWYAYWQEDNFVKRDQFATMSTLTQKTKKQIGTRSAMKFFQSRILRLSIQSMAKRLKDKLGMYLFN